MEWLRDTYRILYSRIDLDNSRYGKEGIEFIYQELLNYKENGNLFVSLGEDQTHDIKNFIGLVTDIQILNNKFVFQIHELKPEIFNMLKINRNDYEIDIYIEGVMQDKIRVDRVSSILSIVRRVDGE